MNDNILSMKKIQILIMERKNKRRKEYESENYVLADNPPGGN